MQRQRIAQRRVRRFPPWLIRTHRMDMRCTGLGHQRLEFGDRIAPPQDERHPALAKAVGQRCQTMMQPPVLRRARMLVEHINRDNRPLGSRRIQRSIVGKAKVLAKPQ